MRLRKHACTALPALLVSSWLGGSAIAQSKSGDETVSRAEFEKRMYELEQKYKDDTAARDAAIADLKRRLEGKVTSDRIEWFEDQKSPLKQEVLDAVNAPNGSSAEESALGRTPVSFNPDFAVVGDFLGTWSNQRHNDACNRMDVREVELDLRAAVDPRADAVAILVFARDVDNPVFPEGDPLSGPDTSVDVEEAYLFLHDFGVPNLTAKVGRFHLRFGQQNILHLHDLPTSDSSFVNQAFLAPEALSDSGVSFSYLIPNPWDQYLEADVEVIAGEWAGSESPTLRGDLAGDSPAVNTHLLWNTDIGDWNLELSGSWLWGHTDPDNALDLNLFGSDITLLRTDPTGGFNNQLLEAEAIYGVIDQPDGSTNEARGAYLLAQPVARRRGTGGYEPCSAGRVLPESAGDGVALWRQCAGSGEGPRHAVPAGGDRAALEESRSVGADCCTHHRTAGARNRLFVVDRNGVAAESERGRCRFCRASDFLCAAQRYLVAAALVDERCASGNAGHWRRALTESHRPRTK